MKKGSQSLSIGGATLPSPHLFTLDTRKDARDGCYKVPRGPPSLVRWESMELQERTDSIVSLTPAAAEKIRALMETETDVSVLRVAIEGGGCSGFQNGLGFGRG